MNHLALYLPVAAYVGALLFLLARVHRNREATNAEQFAVGGRAYSGRVIFLTLAATIVGPGYSLGVVEQTVRHGVGYLAFFTLAAIQLYIVGRVFAPKIQAERTSRTVGDILGRHYGSGTKFLAGLITVAQACAFTGVLCLGGAQVLSAVWDVPASYGVLAIAIVVAAYSSIGGLPAVVRTDVLQFALLCVVGGIALISALWIIFTEPATYAALSSAHLPQPATPPLDITTVISIAVAFLLGEALIPVYAVRGLIASDAQAARSGFSYAAMFALGWFALMGLAGVAFRASGSVGIETPLFALIPAATSSALAQALLLACMGVGILGIVMSSLDSVLHAGAVALTRDVVGAFLPLSEEQQESYSKSGLLLIAIFGASFTIFSQDLIELLLIAYSLWVPTLLFPLAFCLIRPVKSERSALSGILVGIAVYALSTFEPVPFAPPILLGLLANAVAVIAAEALVRPGAARPQEAA